ncbi:N-formylglutamate amidohydrolase [Lichenicoccus sp.]|uniref:N-formylglutamate amidohydrolase n=1 Tax=Lichenicoccus sp. TaxID=2781899 RepID=UPI003D0A73C3
MSESPPTVQELAPVQPFRVTVPDLQASPLLVASPHSGRDYSADFVASSRLSFRALRRSEDSFVDELFARAPELGIPLLQADFPRAFCDVNREPWELDPVMFSDALPSWCNTSSARVSAGFGTIARLVASGEPIYGGKLDFAEAEQRIRLCWKPYHAALATLIEATIARHGVCLLIDAHSMPTLSGPTLSGPTLSGPTLCGSTRAGPTLSRTALSGVVPGPGPGSHRSGVHRQDPDFVLGDAFGTSCAPSVTRSTERFLRERGFRVRRNDPYAGGYVTRHYGRPTHRIHVLQVEIGRGLYMDEPSLERNARFADMQATMGAMLEMLASILPTLLAD